MKKFMLPFVLFLSFSLSSVVSAHNPSMSLTEAQQEVVVLNLLNGIESGNLGLMVSSAQFLSEYKSVKSVIPLMKMLHESENDESKIAAALSLIKIGDMRGVFAVKRASVFDQSKTVRNMCLKFYCAFLSGKTQL